MNERTVIVALGATAVVVTLDDIRQHHVPTPRTYIGVVFAGLVLTLLAEPAPDLAGGLAVLVLVSTVLSRGAGLVGGLNTGTPPASQPPVSPAQFQRAQR